MSARAEGLSGRSHETGAAAQAARPCTKFYGLVEIGPDGTVLYSRLEGDGGRAAGSGPLDLTGRNFFSEVAPFKNVADFRRLLDGFGRGTQPALSADFVCDYDDGPLAVRVLFARIRERTELDVTKSILVHIRKAH